MGNRRNLLAAVFLIALRTEIAAQDVVTVGSVADATPGSVVSIPLKITDRLGTALDRGVEDHRAIQSLAITVEVSPNDAIVSLDVVRSGSTGNLEPRFETQISSGARRSWVVSFDEPVPLAGGGAEEVARLQLQLAPSLAPGTRIDLGLIAETTALSNAAGTLVETAENGALALVDGAVEVATDCTGDTVLCLLDERFEIEVDWTDFAGNSGAGRAVPLTRDSGTFWFFDSDNVELFIKTLDGRGVNGHYWVFYGALSNVEYRIVVTDRTTGQSREYFNPSGTFASVGDTSAFSGAVAPLRHSELGPALPAELLVLDREPAALRLPQRAAMESGAEVPAAGNQGGVCSPTNTALCLLQGRFRVEAEWEDFAGHQGSGRAVPLTAETGYFWFFAPENIELVVKTLDARGVNGHYWVFYGALSNVEFALTVTDTVTGVVRRYENPSGMFASVGDTGAFAGD